MWLLLALFIIVKLLVFHKMNKLHENLHKEKICPKGYFGLVPDASDCNSYYLCPGTIQFFCPNNTQFDLDAYKCVDLERRDGCFAKMSRNLLL
ncbi:chitin binding 1 [Orgyia leucostigma nucleopolyhedrovirus]|uniref:Chitin binding 1 n=1 Tax=Orgyia leucostigma nucleopolyhedrovirus TaxID=490711 RepID=B0FDM7_9ABAC|nr:chitin binding 1 [Orgyia leucostigma nucleopolyhedrovirus]ABY65735.1 chitin binding 1 [Orgyia leucostigma nucleopolyhedrovirus]